MTFIVMTAVRRMTWEDHWVMRVATRNAWSAMRAALQRKPIVRFCVSKCAGGRR